MKKSILILFGFLMFMLISCESNRFEIETTIAPKVTLIGDRIAVEYKLGDLLILDEWSGLNIAELLFLSKDLASKKINLKLTASDGIVEGINFYYNYGNINIRTRPANWNTLYRNADSFPNVKWLVLNDKTIQKGQADKKIEVKKDTKNKVDKNRL